MPNLAFICYTQEQEKEKQLSVKQSSFSLLSRTHFSYHFMVVVLTGTLNISVKVMSYQMTLITY